MAELVTLDRFQNTQQNYHIVLRNSTVMDQQEHYHDYYQICYVVSGELIHRQEGTALTLGAGDAFIIPPGFIHSLHFNNPRTKLYSLAFSKRLLQPVSAQSGMLSFLDNLQNDDMVLLRVVLDQDRRKLMVDLMEGLLRQQNMECAPGLSAAPSITAAIVCTIAQSYFAQPQNAGKLAHVTTYNSVILQCVEYIDRHYKDRLLLSELSKKFGISQSAFCAVFPQLTGVSLKKYIAAKRITEAQVLIRSHLEWTLGRVCAEVGYEDDSTFYRNFIRIAGVSPAAYRKMHSER